jgi:hypothetical protein
MEGDYLLLQLVLNEEDLIEKLVLKDFAKVEGRYNIEYSYFQEDYNMLGYLLCLDIFNGFIL